LPTDPNAALEPICLLPQPLLQPLLPGLSCVVGETLCYVYVLNDDQWAAIPERRRRNMEAEHIPELGWVVASPGRLN